MRRYGLPPERGISYGDRPGCYALILQGDQALLTVEAGPHATEIQLPGGGIDPGENPVAALHREAMEETGWRIQILTRLGAYQRFCYMPDYDRHARKICHIYLARAVQRIAEPTEAHHFTLWASLNDVPELLDTMGDAELIVDSRPVIDRFLKT